MNPYKRLVNMLPSSRVDVGTVTDVHGDGVTVALQIGGTLRVHGTAAQGSRVYIRNGAVDGPAPNLAGVDIFV